jgi:hypothetical protein
MPSKKKGSFLRRSLRRLSMNSEGSNTSDQEGRLNRREARREAKEAKAKAKSDRKAEKRTSRRSRMSSDADMDLEDHTPGADPGQQGTVSRTAAASGKQPPAVAPKPKTRGRLGDLIRLFEGSSQGASRSTEAEGGEQDPSAPARGTTARLSLRKLFKRRKHSADLEDIDMPATPPPPAPLPLPPAVFGDGEPEADLSAASASVPPSSPVSLSSGIRFRVVPPIKPRHAEPEGPASEPATLPPPKQTVSPPTLASGINFVSRTQKSTGQPRRSSSPAVNEVGQRAAP